MKLRHKYPKLISTSSLRSRTNLRVCTLQQRALESGRYQSKVQRYGKIYEEVRALRNETHHSVRDLRERFKKEGLIQNKDQFIVRLIAQVQVVARNMSFTRPLRC